MPLIPRPRSADGADSRTCSSNTADTQRKPHRQPAPAPPEPALAEGAHRTDHHRHHGHGRSPAGPAGRTHPHRSRPDQSDPGHPAPDGSSAWRLRKAVDTGPVLAAGRHRHRSVRHHHCRDRLGAPERNLTYSQFTLATGVPMSIILPIIAPPVVTPSGPSAPGWPQHARPAPRARPHGQGRCGTADRRCRVRGRIHRRRLGQPGRIGDRRRPRRSGTRASAMPPTSRWPTHCWCWSASCSAPWSGTPRAIVGYMIYAFVAPGLLALPRVQPGLVRRSPAPGWTRGTTRTPFCEGTRWRAGLGTPRGHHGPLGRRPHRHRCRPPPAIRVK